MPERINIEQLVFDAATTIEDLRQLARANNCFPCRNVLQAKTPDLLALIRAIDPTLLKHVWADYRVSSQTKQSELTIYAHFGPPQSEQDYVVLYAME
jgi:hypothetical protein